MKILTGIYQRDTGTIAYEGREIEVPDTKAAQRLGISIIHQELNLGSAFNSCPKYFYWKRT